MVSPTSENSTSSLTGDKNIRCASYHSKVGEPYDPSLVVRKASSFDSWTTETREQFPSDSSSSISRTEMMPLPPTIRMMPSSPTPLRCFTATDVFASTKDELRHDLKSLQVRLQKSNAQRIKLEKELVEAKQIARSSRQHLEETLRQYNLLKIEVETIQSSEESQHEGSQIAVLHAQRTVLAQRVLQLLAQNGKLQATSAKVQHQMEQQKLHIQQLKQELDQLRNSDAVIMAQHGATTTHTSRSFWKGRPKPGSEPVLPAMDTPSCHQQASLEQRIQELENQNRLLLDQQEQSKQHWDQDRDQMQQYITVLQQKVVELENAKGLGHTESSSPRKRDFPPDTISCQEGGDDISDKDQLSSTTNSTCSVTNASRSSGTRPSAYLALQGRLQQIETELQEKQAIEDALTRQVEELRQVALEEKQRATSAEERVRSLRSCLNAAWSKPRGQQPHHHPEFSTNHALMCGMSDDGHTETSTVNEESTVSTPPDNSSPTPRRVEIPNEIMATASSDALNDLQKRVHVLEEKIRALNSKNSQLHRRLEQKTQENSELEDLVAQLKSNNGDGAETIFALLSQLEKSAEIDAHQKSLRQQVDQLTTERDDLATRLDETLQQVDHLTKEKDNLQNDLIDMRKQVDRLTVERDNLSYRLRATERQLAHAQDRVTELNDLNERLSKEAQESSIGRDLQDKIDAQEKELSDYKLRYDQLKQESVQKDQIAKGLRDQNEMLLVEIAELSKISMDLSTYLDLAKSEIERLCQKSVEKSDDPHAANETGEHQTKNRDSASENEGSQEQPALLAKAAEIESLETSLKEANEQRREAEATLASMRLDLDRAKAKIEELSTGRATAHVDVSTNPTSIDSRLHIYELETENQSLSRRCQDNENRLKQALMQCNQHEDMLKTLTEHVQSLQAQITELEEAKRELTHQSETKLQATYDVLDQSMKVLESEIVSLVKERTELKAQVESQRVSLESATSKLHHAEDALQAFREQHQSPTLQGKDHECQDHEPYVQASPGVSGNEVSDIKLSASNDDQLPCENTATRSFKDLFSFSGLKTSI